MWALIFRVRSLVVLFVMAALLSGCAGPRWPWRGKSYASQTALPPVEAPLDYAAYNDRRPQTEYVPAQESRASGSSCSGGSCSSCRTAAAPAIRSYSDPMGQTALAQQSRSSGGGCNCGSCGTGTAPPSSAGPSDRYGNVAATTPLSQDNRTAPVETGAYVGQKTCPVTGEALGSMGPPVPVSVKGQTVYVCCAGCVDTVQQNPDLYLGKVMRERGGQ